MRLFHWSLVAAFATAWLSADEAQPVHEIAGYTVAALVAFLGSADAQFITGSIIPIDGGSRAR